LHFPQQKYGGVSGVSQHILLMHAKDMGFTCTQITMSPSTLFEADEIVITNAINGAVPVRQIQKKEWNSTKLAYAINTLFKNLK
jgi:branched-subunit amino acid aminotransferase/4-amino-4-deoxychorismate lyase